MDHATPALRALSQIGRRYPEAWRQLEDLRDKRQELGGWPRWCHCPMAGAYAVASSTPGGGPADIAAVGVQGAVGNRAYTAAGVQARCRRARGVG